MSKAASSSTTGFLPNSMARREEKSEDSTAAGQTTNSTVCGKPLTVIMGDVRSHACLLHLPLQGA